MIGDATPERFAEAMRVVLDDPGVDAGSPCLRPGDVQPDRGRPALIEVEQASPKPVLTSWMGGRSMQEAVNLFNRSGVPTYCCPNRPCGLFPTSINTPATGNCYTRHHAICHWSFRWTGQNCGLCSTPS